MQINKSAAKFNLWRSHRTWFWSLMYPERAGGAIGAAPSEVEALYEVYAAIERARRARDRTADLDAPRGD